MKTCYTDEKFIGKVIENLINEKNDTPETVPYHTG